MTAGSGYRVSYIGQFSEFSFGELLFSLAFWKETGALFVTQEKVIKKIFFQEGRLVYVESSLAREGLLRFLFEKKEIGQDNPLEFLRETADLETPFMDWLVQKDLVSPHAVNPIIAEIFRHRLLDVFHWKDGDYFFRFDEPLPEYGRNWSFLAPLHEIVLQGIREGYNLQRLKASLRDALDMSPRLLRGPHEIRNLIRPSPAEAKLIQAVDGKTTLMDLALASVLDMEQSLRLLFFLKVSGLMDLPESSSTSQRLMRDLNDEEKKFADSILQDVPNLLKRNPFQMFQIPRSQDLTDENVRRGYYTLAHRYYKSGVTDKMPAPVQELSRRLFERISNFFEALIKWVKAREAGHFASFINMAQSALLSPQKLMKVDSLFLTGLHKFQWEDKQEGLDDIREAARKRDWDGEYKTRHAQMKYRGNTGKKNAFKEALAAYRRSLDMDRYYVGTHLALGQCYELTGETEQAHKFYRDALELDPDSQEAKNGALRTLSLSHKGPQKDKSDAEENKRRLGVMEKFVEEKLGKDLYQVLGLGTAASQAEIKKAYFQLAKEFHPDASGSLKDRPVAVQAFVIINEAYDTLSSDGKRRIYDRGIRAREHLITRKIHESRVRLQQKRTRAKGLVGNSDFDGAIELLKVVIEADPDDKESLTYLAWARYQRDAKRDPLADQVAEKALSELSKRFSDYAQPHYFLGKIALKQGNYSRAEFYFHAAQGIDPTSVEINREIRLLGQRLASRSLESERKKPDAKSLFGRRGRKK